MLKSATLLLSALAAGLAITGSSQAATCKVNFIQGANGALLTGYSRKAARQNALVVWETKVVASVGPQWSRWEISHNRSLECFRNKARRWKCTARAQPCKG